MMRRALPVALGLLALSAAPAGAESPRSMMLELHAGPYQPQIDDQFDDAKPYDDVFGNDSLILFGFHLDYQLWQGFGSLAVGGGVRYGWVDGRAIAGDGTQASDDTTLHMLPLTASVVYRLDAGAVKVGIPLVPYVKGGLSYHVWWVTNGRDEVANARDLSGKGRVGRGGTFGWHVGGGLQLLLDWLHPSAAAEFDAEAGVNNSYLFAEFLLNKVNDFGGSKSMELSDNAFSFGLMFEF